MFDRLIKDIILYGGVEMNGWGGSRNHIGKVLGVI